MLNFRNTILVFAAVLLALLAFDYFVQVNRLIYPGIIVAFILLLAWGSKNIQSGFYIKSVCKGDINKKRIAITFDDGPDAQVTPMILDVLKKYNVKATFFVIGSKAELNPDIIKRIDGEGHLIGAHSYSHHFFFDLFSTRRMQNEMIKTEKFLYSVIRKRIRLFRPPYGVTNPALSKAIRHMEYMSVGWSLRSDDTTIREESRLLENVTGKISNGDIVLFHDNKPWNVKAVEGFLEFLNKSGYQASRLDEFLSIHAYVY